jgi:hypothetical protein
MDGKGMDVVVNCAVVWGREEAGMAAPGFARIDVNVARSSPSSQYKFLPFRMPPTAFMFKEITVQSHAHENLQELKKVCVDEIAPLTTSWFAAAMFQALYYAIGLAHCSQRRPSQNLCHAEA